MPQMVRIDYYLYNIVIFSTHSEAEKDKPIKADRLPTHYCGQTGPLQTCHSTYAQHVWTSLFYLLLWLRQDRTFLL